MKMKNSPITEIALSDDSPLVSDNFLIGVATSSYQIEGAAQVDGRVPSIWDTFAATAGKTLNGENGDIACDHYNLWEADFDLLKELGVDCYRFSISWPRIISDLSGSVNQAGIDHYLRQLDRLAELGIKAFVTLYHWDLPQYLEDRGGWTNRETAYAFANYADIVSRAFGDRVAAYITLNEPWCSAMLGYYYGIHAPGHQNRKMAYQAAHHLLLGHGMAVPKIRENAPNSRCGASLNFYPVDSVDDEFRHLHACEIANADANLLFLQPILQGEYPLSLMSFFAKDAPLVLPGDMETISQEIDFLGVNYYTKKVVDSDPESAYVDVKYEGDHATSIGWEIYPHGLLRILRLLSKFDNLPPMYITENGMANWDEVADGAVDDSLRVQYINDHFLAVEQAIKEGIDVRGFFIWSFLDNFEWAEGYSQRFGIVHVDYKTQKRTLKNSALALKTLLGSR